MAQTNPTTTIWMRLEPRTRRPDKLKRALTAPLMDPLWMLTRQWQTGEMSGEDGGAPASIELFHHTSPLRAPDGAEPVNDGVAEATLFGEPPRWTWAERARLGQTLDYTLAEALPGADRDLILDALADRHPLRVDLNDAELPGELRAASLLDGALLDGHAAWLAVEQGERLPRPSGASDEGWRTFEMAMDAWVTEARALYGDPNPIATAPERWRAPRLRYESALHTTHPSGDPLTLPLGETTRDGLSWCSVDQRGEAPPKPLPGSPARSEVIPSRVIVRGMPAPRWWDFEDSARSLLNIQAQDHDLARMMWLEFLLVGSDDWFLAPLRVPRGSLVWLSRVCVRDVFGVVNEHVAADAEALINSSAPLPDRGKQRWSLFRATALPDLHAGGELDERLFTSLPRLADYLVVPPGVGQLGEDGPRVEELRLMRDEDANLVWAVEHIVEDRLGRPVAGRDLHAHRAGTGDDAPLGDVRSPNAEGPLRYRARSPVPAHWTPFVAQRWHGEKIQLRRAALWSESGAPRPTRSTLLDEIGEHGTIEGALPRSGLRIVRQVRRARAVDGGTVTWTQRSRESGAGEGSSGLRFDLALPHNNLPKVEE